MKIVNKVVSFQINDAITYEEIKKKYATKVYNGRPTMLLLKTINNTIIIFQNLKGRVMGNPNTINETINDLPFKVSNVVIQTCTYTHSMTGEINLLKITYPFHYEGELFPAAYIKLMNAHVNIFHTGKLVITGVKNDMNAFKIITLVESLLIPFLQ